MHLTNNKIFQINQFQQHTQNDFLEMQKDSLTLIDTESALLRNALEQDHKTHLKYA